MISHWRAWINLSHEMFLEREGPALREEKRGAKALRRDGMSSVVGDDTHHVVPCKQEWEKSLISYVT